MTVPYPVPFMTLSYPVPFLTVPYPVTLWLYPILYHLWLYPILYHLWLYHILYHLWLYHILYHLWLYPILYHLWLYPILCHLNPFHSIQSHFSNMHLVLSYHPLLFHSLQACQLKLCTHSLAHTCHGPFILTLNCGLEGMHSVVTWADQRKTTVCAIVIKVIMMLGANMKVWC
jgi:hypothetical protein